MLRKGKKYPVTELLNQIQGKRINLDGDSVSVSGKRFKLFQKNIQCRGCGIKGQYFVKEKGSELDRSWHLNLYALNDINEEILMTKDHIIPKSKGGENDLSNLQVLCLRCNLKKAAN